jgi:hypothetical protein
LPARKLTPGTARGPRAWRPSRPKVSADGVDHVGGARERVLRRAEELAQARRIGWPPSDRPRSPRPLGKRYQRQRAGLEERLATALHLLSFDDIARLLVDLSTVAETEGWLVLEPPPETAEDSFLRLGVWMIVDGTEPDLVLDLLETWRDSLLRHHELTMDMTTAGLLAVSAGDNPAMLQLREQAWYRLQIEIDYDGAVDIDKLKAQLQQTSHARMSLDERATFMAHLTAIARREGILHLRQLLGHTGDEFLELGLSMFTQAGPQEPVQPAMEVLAARKQTLMEQHRTRYRMVIEGLLRIQAGESTELVEARVRSLY